MSISTWPQDQRPREKLLKQGAPSLTDAELLAIFLRTGVRGKNAVQLGQDLLNTFDGVAGLFTAPPESLREVKGLGPAKMVQLLAVRELAARVLSGEMKQRDSLTSPQAVKDYLRLRLMHLDLEVFIVVFLDAQHRVIASEELFAGTLTQTSVYPREIVKRCLALNAAAVIFAQNRPSPYENRPREARDTRKSTRFPYPLAPQSQGCGYRSSPHWRA
ncbi:MAG: JAB domain-containing protein [Betaproteobacteria bacterium]|nr:JAB domain-containing protein [Betaproteobacteria bacterium]